MTKAAAYFSEDYQSARARFVAVAEAAGATLHAYTCPVTGPDGRQIFCDTAWLGDPAAETVLVTLSATHGGEGFCGSGVQCGWLESGLWREVPRGTAQLHIHAINAYGFAWLRRVTEDNVDLNRNFVDFSKALPPNPGYDALAGAICPRQWDQASVAAADAVLDAYAASHGLRERQSAISKGQYNHPDGVFFGGKRPTWARRVLEMIFRVDLSAAKRVAVLDYHTGLGPRGHGERICGHAPGSAGLARATAWFGDDFTCPALGNSSSVELTGHNKIGMAAALDGAELTAVTMEYGTRPMTEVLAALRADNWLHAHGDPGSQQGRAIKRQVREAFYIDADDWKEMVFERAVETQRLALAGLNGGP